MKVKVIRKDTDFSYESILVDDNSEIGQEVIEEYFDNNIYKCTDELTLVLDEYRKNIFDLNKEKNELEKALNDTDYVSIQWNEEIASNQEHYRTLEEYNQILSDRQIKRLRIREIKNLLG